MTKTLTAEVSFADRRAVEAVVERATALLGLEVARDGTDLYLPSQDGRTFATMMTDVRTGKIVLVMGE